MTGNADQHPVKKLPLSRDRIVAAAIDFADKHGIESLSMRHLGKTMGVEAMSLYNHVANKDEILDLMADAMAAEMTRLSGAVPGPGDWRDVMRRRAKAYRGVCAHHPWAGTLLDTRLNANPGRLSYYDAMFGALSEAGFSPRVAVQAFMIMDSYLNGFEAQLRSTRSTETCADKMATQLNNELPAGSYPHLARISAFIAEHGYDQEAEFDTGFEVILESIKNLADRW
jgi:AcrR family transcriptional regulator